MAKKLVYLSKIYIIHAVRDSWFICSRGRLTSTRRSLPCRAWLRQHYVYPWRCWSSTRWHRYSCHRLSNQNSAWSHETFLGFKVNWQRGSTSGRYSLNSVWTFIVSSFFRYPWSHTIALSFSWIIERIDNKIHRWARSDLSPLNLQCNSGASALGAPHR